MQPKILAKKLLFAIPFLSFYIFFCVNFSPFLKNPTLILSLDKDVFIQVIFLLIFLIVTCIFFVIFAVLSDDIRLIIPTAAITAYSSLIFLGSSYALLMVIGALITFGIVYFSVHKTLATYLTFKPTSLFSPSVRQTATLLLITSSIVFYISARINIQTEGFKLPDSVLNFGLQFVLQQTSQQEAQKKLPPVSDDQLDQLRQNPQLLSQFGLTPAMLDDLATRQLNKTQTDLSKELLKKALDNQMQILIKPYLGFIPILLALSFFIIFKSGLPILSLFVDPILWIVFFILEKTKFISFTTESRPVKKLVVS